MGNHNLRFLVAEDEFILALEIKQLLEDMGFEVTSLVSTALEAITRSETEKPDIILMDVRLPGINGNTATGIIKKINPKIKIIAQTAYATATDRQSAMESGSDDYISKPINKELLIEKLYYLFK